MKKLQWKFPVVEYEYNSLREANFNNFAILGNTCAYHLYRTQSPKYRKITVFWIIFLLIFYNEDLKKTLILAFEANTTGILQSCISPRIGLDYLSIFCTYFSDFFPLCTTYTLETTPIIGSTPYVATKQALAKYKCV